MLFWLETGLSHLLNLLAKRLWNHLIFIQKKNLKRLRKLKSKIADSQIIQDKIGTVGAVAIDKKGNISAATSTGGMTNKMPGRVGDTPIIGSGTWAQNQVCGVSSTGHGEFFIKFRLQRSLYSNGIPQSITKRLFTCCD